MKYPYNQINLLEKPHNYMYAPFQGQELLDSYYLNRMSFIHCHFDIDGRGEIIDKDILISALPAINLWLNVNSFEMSNNYRKILTQVEITNHDRYKKDNKNLALIAQSLKNVSVNETVNTLKLLHTLNAAQIVKPHDDKIKVWLDRIVQRFEVTKKIYEFYPTGFKKGEGQNSFVRLYWLFSLALCLYYIRTNKIKYLSTLLKVCDLLCSLTEIDLQEYIPKNGLSVILLIEVVSVTNLAHNKGVSFAAY